MNRFASVMTICLLALGGHLSAVDIKITTHDRGDGVPGVGADGFIEEHGDASLIVKTGTGKRAASMLIRSNHKKDNSWGVLRFDLSQLKGREVLAAQLNLNLLNKGKGAIKLWGLKDKTAGVNHGGSLDFNDHDSDLHDEFLRKASWIEKVPQGLWPPMATSKQ